MISGSPSVQSISLDAAPTERRTFGRGVVGRHRFLHSHPSEPNIAGRQDGSIVADPSMNMLAAEAKAARAIAESSDDGRSDIEVPTVVAKLSTVQLSKRDSEATQTDMSRFTSVADLTSPQQPQSTRSLHSATASQSDDWVVQTLSASDTGIAMLVKRAKQSMVSGKVRSPYGSYEVQF